MEPVRVLVVDDHPIIRDGLDLFLSSTPGFAFLGQAATVREGLQKLAQLPADIVVLDLALQDSSGLDAIGLFPAVRPQAQVVVYSGIDDPGTIRRAIESGARGYVVKGESIAELVAVLKKVRTGEVGFSRRISSVVIGASLKKPGGACAAADRFASLSPRERQVFQLLAQGLTTDEIVDMLDVSPKTVAKHRVNLFRKLGVRNTVELVIYARDHGLCGPGQKNPGGA